MFCFWSPKDKTVNVLITDEEMELTVFESSLTQGPLPEPPPHSCFRLLRHSCNVRPGAHNCHTTLQPAGSSKRGSKPTVLTGVFNGNETLRSSVSHLFNFFHQTGIKVILVKNNNKSLDGADDACNFTYFFWIFSPFRKSSFFTK